MKGGYSSDKPGPDHPAGDNFALSPLAGSPATMRFLLFGRERGLSKLIVRYLGVALALMVFIGPVGAEVVQDMYSAEVPVADQSSAELVRAARLGLSEVRQSGRALRRRERYDGRNQLARVTHPRHVGGKLGGTLQAAGE